MSDNYLKSIMDARCIKLLKDFNENDLIFKSMRKTNTGSRIIDVDGNTMFQTCWLNILYDVENSICVNSEQIKDILSQIDKMVIDHSSLVLGFEKPEIIKMYRSLTSDTKCYFYISILSNTVLFDRYKNFYKDKTEIKSILKQGQYVRFIFNFKKIYFKDHEITFPLELQQIELA